MFMSTFVEYIMLLVTIHRYTPANKEKGGGTLKSVDTSC